MRIPLLSAVLLAASLAGCASDVRTLAVEPPLPRTRAIVSPVQFQTVSPVALTTPAVVQPQNPVLLPAREEPPKPRCVTAGNPSWAAGTPAKWTHILIHHSAMESGNADIIDRMHRQKQWDELGYHFVIDNGNGGVGGAVEVGSRWAKQKHGAHCRVDPNDTNFWNEHGIGICLVGNFEKHKPSEAQMASAARLVAFLMEECNIPRQNILGHGQVPGETTACPGHQFPYGDLLRRVDTLLKK